MSKNGAIAFLIIVFLLIVGFAYYGWYTSNDQQKHLAIGCEPRAWNSWGQPTIWSCPVNRT